MLAENQVEAILRKLEKIESDLDYIRGHMVDIDIVLTKEEEKELEESLREYRKGTTYGLRDL
ncbi:MAG: hypothetical protein KAU14_04970 [Thermoplasmata archaeon]|nr:hypothetical protein [Thermoplasmata archaeon]